MLSTAAQVKSIILKHQGRASKQQITRELNLGLEYIGLICRELERKGYLVFRKGLYSLIITEHKPPKPAKRRTKVLRRQSRKSPIRQLAEKNVSAKSVWSAIPKMTKDLRDILERAGYKTIESLADAPVVRFMQETKFELPKAAGLINQAKKILNKIGE